MSGTARVGSVRGERNLMGKIVSWGRVPRRVLPVAALVVATSAACGSSAKSSSPSSVGSATTTSSGAAGSTASTVAASSNSQCASVPGVTPTSVKVGISYAATGSTGTINETFAPAVHAAFNVINANGGVNGRQIAWSDADTASDPGKALAAGQGLVQSNGAFAILNGTSLSAPLFPYLVQNNIPTFDVLTDSPLMSSAKNLFTTEGAWDPATGGTLTAPLFAKFLQSQGVTTMAIFDSGSQSGLAGTKADVTQAAKLGIKTVYEDDAASSGSFDATSVALRVKQVHPDALVFPLALAGSISIYKAAAQQGYTPKVTLMTTAYDPTALTAGITGVYTTVSFVPYLGAISSLPAPAQAFRNAMTKYAPSTALNLYAAGGWADAYLFSHALQLAGTCPTRAGVISAMRAVSSYNPADIMPANIQYTPGVVPDGNPLNCTEVVKLLSRFF